MESYYHNTFLNLNSVSLRFNALTMFIPWSTTLPTAVRSMLHAIGTSNTDNCDETLVVTLGMIFDDDSTRHNVDSEETVRR